jgi:hypothetical protein
MKKRRVKIPENGIMFQVKAVPMHFGRRNRKGKFKKEGRP